MLMLVLQALVAAIAAAEVRPRAVAACTGNSTKLPQAQCEAWIDLYDSTGGDNWAGNAAACTRTDPCSCDTSVAPFTWRVCDPTNTMVQTM